MLSCTEERMCVGVRGFMFSQTLPSISLNIWFLEGFDLYILYIYILYFFHLLYLYIYKYIYVNIYIYIYI